MPSLQDDSAKRILLEELDRARDKHGFKLLAYVVMPDHVHLVLHPPDGMQMGLVVREIKSKSARRFFAQSPAGREGDRRVFWQKRCYDHNCRTPSATVEKITYCHNNPVRRRLVKEPGEWGWSSYNFYLGAEDVPIEVDRFEI